MTEESKQQIYTTSAAKSRSEAPTLSEIQKTMKDLRQKEVSLFTGMPVIKDPTGGLMCSPNGYIVVMGEKMYARIKEGAE
jgi:hypothetical protein